MKRCALDFTLRQMQYLVAAIDHGSISAAADACHVSAGAVSLGIRDLENLLGHTLLTRQRSRGIRPTGAAHVLMPYARRFVQNAEEIRAMSTDLRQDLVGRVAIGCYSPLAPIMVPFIAQEFARPHPQMTVSITEGSSDTLQARMLAGELDCVIMQEWQRIDCVRLIHIQERRPHVILPQNHRFAECAAVSLKKLSSEPMILLDAHTVRKTLLPLLNRLGITPQIDWATPQIETVRGMVARGLGWSVLIQTPPSSVSYEGLPLVARPIEEPIGSNDTCIAFPEGESRLSRRFEYLTAKLRQHVESLQTPAS